MDEQDEPQTLGGATRGPGAPRDMSTYIGWYVGGVILMLRAVEVIVLLFKLPTNPYVDQTPQILGGCGMALLMLIFGIALCCRSAIARWVVIVVAMFAAAFLLCIGVMASHRNPSALIPAIVIGFANVFGWIFALSRTPDPQTIVIGAILLVGSDVFGLMIPANTFASVLL